MPDRFRLLAVVVALCLLYSCSRTAGPTAPAVPTPAPTATPAPTVDISGSWNASGSCLFGTFSISIRQTGTDFTGFYIFHTDSASRQVDLQGTIAGNSLSGTFSEDQDSYWGPICSDRGDFQGHVSSPSSITISIPATAGDKPCCNGPLSLTLSR